MLNTEVITNLRALADWLEAHPELPQAACFSGIIRAYGSNQRADAAAVARAMGNAEKGYSGEKILLHKHFGQGDARVLISYVADRDQVCKRVEVGTRLIPASPERTEPIYEWECEPLLGVKA